LETIITFLITLFVAFVIVRIFRLQTKPIPFVQVINSDIKTV
jgi:hypothetical protein